MIITLTRDSHQPRPEQCTLGTLAVNGKGRFQTIERPWAPDPIGKGGIPNFSCIPLGLYRMEPRTTESRGRHWILSNPALGIYRYESNIPAGSGGRALILMHAANWAHELLGCIGPGKARISPRQNGNEFDEWMVSASRAAMNEIANLIGTSIDLQLAIVLAT